MTPLVVENEPPVTFLRRKMTGGRFSMGVVIRRYTGRLVIVGRSTPNDRATFGRYHDVNSADHRATIDRRFTDDKTPENMRIGKKKTKHLTWVLLQKKSSPDFPNFVHRPSVDGRRG